MINAWWALENYDLKILIENYDLKAVTRSTLNQANGNSLIYKLYLLWLYDER